jgi:hypothetical protein
MTAEWPTKRRGAPAAKCEALEKDTATSPDPKGKGSGVSPSPNPDDEGSAASALPNPKGEGSITSATKAWGHQGPLV